MAPLVALVSCGLVARAAAAAERAQGRLVRQPDAALRPEAALQPAALPQLAQVPAPPPGNATANVTDAAAPETSRPRRLCAVLPPVLVVALCGGGLMAQRRLALRPRALPGRLHEVAAQGATGSGDAAKVSKAPESYRKSKLLAPARDSVLSEGEEDAGPRVGAGGPDGTPVSDGRGGGPDAPRLDGGGPDPAPASANGGSPDAARLDGGGPDAAPASGDSGGPDAARLWERLNVGGPIPDPVAFPLEGELGY